MTQSIRRFLIFEAVVFGIAASVHAGLLLHGYEHRQATIAESVIAAALVAGIALTWVWPAWTRAIGGIVQAGALLGTLVGLFAIAVGVGPRTVPDVVYHLGIVGVLAWGLTVVVQGPRRAPRPGGTPLAPPAPPR